MRAIIPHFKGDVPPPSGKNEASNRLFFEKVMTGVSPENRVIQPEEYLAVLKFVAREQSAVAQNVARVFAASLEAEDARRNGEQARLFFLEGCTWDWGTAAPRKGAEVSAAMYNVVPSTLRRAAAHIEPLTRRTRDEFEQVLRLATAHAAASVTTVTHAYHAFRTRSIGAYINRTQEHDLQIDVRTPGRIADAWEEAYILQPEERFVIDAIRIAEPSWKTNLKEGVKEYGPLLGFHVAERMTGIDLEKKILERMAVRHADENEGD